MMDDVKGMVESKGPCMKKVEVRVDASGKVDLDGFMTLEDLQREIISPRIEAATEYAHRLERDAMETALRFGCRAVYVTEWCETHGVNDDMKWGTRWDICWKCFPYEFRGEAFRLSKESGGNVTIIDFKGVIELPYDIFCHIENPNRDLAERIRERWLMHRSISAP